VFTQAELVGSCRGIDERIENGRIVFLIASSMWLLTMILFFLLPRIISKMRLFSYGQEQSVVIWYYVVINVLVMVVMPIVSGILAGIQTFSSEWYYKIGSFTIFFSLLNLILHPPFSLLLYCF
jgi:hypothetical protein